MAKEKFNIDLPAIIERQKKCDESVFPCIGDLLTFVESFDTSGCYFRGQSGLWDITSSLYRHYGTPRFKDACTTITTAVKWLKQNQYIYPVVGDNDNNAVAIAQHYGYPTDLVDITTDTRTAAYFAISDNRLVR